MAKVILPPWHPTMPNTEVTDMQLILLWEAEEKEVWEETAIRMAVKSQRVLGIPVTYAQERAAFVVLRNKGVVAYSGTVSSIVSLAEAWMRDNPLHSEEEEELAFELAAERHAYGW